MTTGPQPDNPYPGLRAFEPEEAELFFGRERESDELRRRLRTTRLLAVVGSSGSGKSSLVRCGLIPSLHGGFMAGTGSNWRVAITRPGTDPIAGLADALDRPEVLGIDAEGPHTRRTVLEVMLRDSSLGLAEAVRQAQLPAGDNLLLLVDQFEELFRFRRSRTARAGGDDAAAYVRLLIEASRQEHLPIFVALTMRSEFIGECLTFDRLPEAINAGQYLIPRMSRDALRAAIAGPAAVRGATMAPRLLARLLNEVADDLDRLPVLQHALMRTWQAWARDHTGEEPIDTRHYEAIGTMSEALSRHADEAYGDLGTARERRIAERLFKTLTETTEDGHGVRRPTAAGRLADVCSASISELEGVIDRFRAPGRAFLQPPAGVRLQPEDVIDISHESLMRLWTRLAGWVREEGRAVDIYRRLSRSAAQHAAGEASLWRPPELTLGLRWLRETAPTTSWAGDAGTFERAIAFLRRSRQAHLLKITLAFIGAAAAVALTIGYFHREARRQRDENVQLQRQVERLQADTADAGQAGQTQSAQVQSLRERRAGLQSEVDRLQQVRGELDGQVAALRDANRGLEADLTRISSDMTRLQERREALQAEFVRLGVEQRDLSQRTERLERATPALQAQVSAVRAQVDALVEQNRTLQRLVRETRPCPRASVRPPPPTDSTEHASAGASSGAAPPEPVPGVPPDPPSSDALRKQIGELTRELARLLQERARLQDEARFLEQENALLDRQRQTLKQENERMAAERGALEERQRALRDAVRLAETERNELAARVEDAEGRNRTKREQVTAARQKHREFEERAVADAGLIADHQSHAERLRADNTRLAGILTPHVDRLIKAARSPQTPADLAALLALQAWRWAPYDTDDPTQPAIYNTLWQVLHRRDEPAALRLLAPGDPAGGRLATTRTQVMAAALCERVTRPLTGDEWRRFMPEDACFTAEAARPCTR